MIGKQQGRSAAFAREATGATGFPGRRVWFSIIQVGCNTLEHFARFVADDVAMANDDPFQGRVVCPFPERCGQRPFIFDKHPFADARYSGT